MLLALDPGHLVTAAPSRRASRRRERTPEAVALAPAVLAPADTGYVVGERGFAQWTAAIGQRIDEHGLSAVAGELDELLAVARRRGVAPVAAEVLADPTQPEPARYRAFAHVVSALVAPPPA